MKLESLFEAQSYSVRKITRSDREGLSDFVDFYNESDQLSWTLTPARLLSKIGSNGRLYALYFGDELVGTIGLKESTISPDSMELGYIMIAEQHRSLRNVMKLYNGIKKKLTKFDLVYATTNKDNRTINKLLEFSNKFKKVMLIRSNFSTNQLYVWVSTVSGDVEENTKKLRDDYGSYVLRLI